LGVLSRVSSYDWLGSGIAFPIGLAIAAPLVGGLGIRSALTLVALLASTSILGLITTPSIRNLSAPGSVPASDAD